MTDSKSPFLRLGRYTDTMRNALCLLVPEPPLSPRALRFVIYERRKDELPPVADFRRVGSHF